MNLVLLLVLSAAPLPDGEFWVARRGVLWLSYGKDAHVETTWRLECERVEVKGVLVTVGDITFNQREGRLFAPFLSTRPNNVSLRASCDDTLPESPRYASREACKAAQATLVERCDGKACSLNMTPFSLPTCDPAMTELRALASLAVDVDHEQATKTLELLSTLTKRGGALWERGACAKVAVKAKRDGTVLRGPDWELEGVFEPLFHRARLAGTRGWRTDGGLGSWGSSASTEPLLLGKGLIVLGRRVLYVDEGGCAAASQKQ